MSRPVVKNYRGGLPVSGEDPPRKDRRERERDAKRERSVRSFELIVLGRPVGKGRPRHGQGRTWTPRETTLAEQSVRAAWEQSGATRLEGPITLHVLLGVSRPQSHYRKDGTLSAEGARNPQPARKKPDVDNALKLVMDALNTRAWGDDVQIVQAQVERLWDSREYTRVIAREVNTDVVRRVAA